MDKEPAAVNLNKIEYSALSSKQKEIFNFQKVAALLADYGFNCIKLSDDWHGADFLAYHKDGEETLRVQLKSRLTIAKKYVGRNLYMAFPLRGLWYLVEHDNLVRIVGDTTKWLSTDSWITAGGYSSDAPNRTLESALHDNVLGPANDMPHTEV